MNRITEIYHSMEYGPAPESASIANAWLERHSRTFDLYINGTWTAPDTGEHFATHDPSTGGELARVAMAGMKSVDEAVKAARTAQSRWAMLSGNQRARHLYALARGIQRNARLLAVIESLDNGKPLRETRDIDIPLVARHFYHHAGWAQLATTELRGMAPLGVIGQIIPWNFPLLMLAWKIAPALATGNTVVLKPAEFTPLSALLFADLCAQAGIPKGVINIITGDGSTGAALVAHPDVDKIAFTGSTEVGRQIRTATAGSGKHLTLELGGKSPFIVFDDADLDSAVEGVVDAIWFNQGQVCCAGSRLLIQEAIAEEFLARLRRRMTTLRVGAPLDKCIDMGAIVAPVQLQRIQAMVEQGCREGAQLWQPDAPLPQDGSFYPPSLLTRVTPASTVAQEEIFGPVVVAMTFRTPDEAVELANNSRYGLAASVWSETLSLALDIAPRLKCGVVWINSTNVFDAACGFGGVRESGFGREGGLEGAYAYVRPAFIPDLPRQEDSPATEPAYPIDTPPHPASTPLVAAGIDRTAKLYIGGKQRRPDGNYSRPVRGHDGSPCGEVGEGSRKDIRDAVEAARLATGWGLASAHSRAQVLYYIAENLEPRRDEFVRRLVSMVGDEQRADQEFNAAVNRLFLYGAWADKFEGVVHNPPGRNVTIAMHEPIGIIGMACSDDFPLLGFVSLMAPAIAMGNRIVIVPSQPWPLAATDLYQVLETSDVPAGVVNIVTGTRDELAQVLAQHDEVESMWYFGPARGSRMVELTSVGNMKRTWVSHGRQRDWLSPAQGEGREFLREAVTVKNIWIPYGE